jgi:uncharacterized glyoxalase superfamily protein PhnB
MVTSASKLIDFTKSVFNAELITITKSEGSEAVTNAEIQIGGSTIFFTDASIDGTCNGCNGTGKRIFMWYNRPIWKPLVDKFGKIKPKK